MPVLSDLHHCHWHNSLLAIRAIVLCLHGLPLKIMFQIFVHVGVEAECH